MTKTPEEINKEMIDAQLKLSDIMTAINRERLYLENFQKNNKINLELKDKLQKEIENFELEESNKKQDLLKIEKRNKDKIEILNSEFIKKENEFNSILNSKINEIENQEIIIDSKNNEIQKLIEKQKKEENSHKEIINNIKKDIIILEDKKNELIKTNSNIELSVILLEKNLISINESFAIKNKELNKILDETLLSNKRKTELNDELINLISKIEDKEDNIKKLNFEMKPLEEEHNHFKKEIEDMKDKISEFIKNKITFQNEKQDLLNKEEFIKDKYQQAGIKY